MKDKITVIIIIRNRDSWRIENQVKSIRNNGANPSFLIIDYGSNDLYSNTYINVCKNLDLAYHHVFAEGLPWSRSNAINIGVKISVTQFVVISDVDMEYNSNPFEYCLQNYKDKTVFHAEAFWLPKNGNKKNAIEAGHGSAGGFVFAHRDTYEKLNGMEERMKYWGLEDLDWTNRLSILGYNTTWLPMMHKIYHVWHPVSESGNLRPITASINSIKYSYDNILNPVRNSEYGESITKASRPILAYIANNTPNVLQLKTNEFINWETAEKVIKFLKNNEFVKIELEQRLKKRPLDKFRNSVKKLLKPITALTGTRIVDNVNENFDYLYELIPLFERELIRDYFISDDLSSIYCLRKN